MGKVTKTCAVKIVEQRNDGGRILISTPAVDRDKDRVFPGGVRSDTYMKNPVVQWGHDYSSPFSTIGKTTNLEITPDGIIADFELRPAANDQDPQNVVLLLWNGGWVRAASIGFIPRNGTKNEFGGLDFTEVELLEWSLVSIPANQEALRLAVKGLDDGDSHGDVSQLVTAESEPAESSAEAPVQLPARAWVRRLDVESPAGKQTVFGCAYTRTVDFAEDATTLAINADGECEEIPHPNAGKTVTYTDITFVPPVELAFDEAAFGCSGSASEDELLKGWGGDFQLVSKGDVIAELPVDPAQKQFGAGIEINKLTRSVVQRAKKQAIQAIHKRAAILNKRGRVLSAANESELRSALDDIDAGSERIRDVLAQVDSEADQSGKDIERAAQLPAPSDEAVAAMLGDLVKAFK